MEKNYIRIAIGSLLFVLLLLFLALILKNTEMLWWGFGWSSLAILLFALSMAFWAQGKGTKYILNAVFPMVMIKYLIAALVVSLFFVLIDQIGISLSPIWISLCQTIVLIFFIWKVLALDAARETIIAVEENVKATALSWRITITCITAIRDRSEGADRVLIERITDNIRTADPMEHQIVAPITDKINEQISDLSAAVDQKDSEKVKNCCNKIEQLVKDRAAKLLLVK